MEKILDINNVTKEYRMGEVVVQALRGVSFQLFAGEFVIILGPSGSGKSTLLNILGGIDKSTSGNVIYRNKDICAVPEKELTRYRRIAVGFVFQFYNLIPNLTARENILLAMELSENPIPVGKLLENIGLADRAGHFPSQLSGGQQQRVAIARALSKNPDLLLCDEPTGALDFPTGIQVLSLLKNFNRKYGKTVIIVTHNAEFSKLGDRVFYIKDGLLDRITENPNPMTPEEVTW